MRFLREAEKKRVKSAGDITLSGATPGFARIPFFIKRRKMASTVTITSILSLYAAKIQAYFYGQWEKQYCFSTGMSNYLCMSSGYSEHNLT